MSRIAEILEIHEYHAEKFLTQLGPDVGVVSDIIASDIMTSGVVSISDTATIKDAVDVLLKERVTALVVADKSGRPVGVFSETDLAKYERERPNPALDHRDQMKVEGLNRQAGGGQHFRVETIANDPILEWMTPCVISVGTQDSLASICRTLVDNRIHRVFVINDKMLVGVISSMDVVAALAVVLNRS